MKILIVNNSETACGIKAHGKRMGDTLTSWNEDKYFYTEGIPDPKDWDILIYNYHPATMPWLNRDTIDYNKSIGLIHEVTKDTQITQDLFKLTIVTDPSISLPNSVSTVRPLLPVKPYRPVPNTIGTFGFAFGNKGFHRVVQAVCEEYDQATINMHVTQAHFNGSQTLTNPLEILEQCNQYLKQGITINFNSSYLDDTEIVDMLSQNEINCLFYDPNPGRGISSAVDYCVSSSAPLVLSHCEQFRHVDLPRWPDSKLKDCIDNSKILKLQKDWSWEIFAKQYDNIVENFK